MKKLYILLFFVFYYSILQAQQQRDVIYLNNHSVIRGSIIQNDSTIVKIKTAGENIFAFIPSEISEIKQEEYSTFKSKGYYNYTSIGILVGDANNDRTAPFSFLMEHNWQLHNSFSAGLVTGIELLNETTFPLGINLKGLMQLTNGSRIYMGASGGYSFSLEKPEPWNGYDILEATGGVLINAELGLVLSPKGNTAFFVAVGYRHNTLNYVREDWAMQEIDQKISFSRLSLKIGFMLF